MNNLHVSFPKRAMGGAESKGEGAEYYQSRFCLIRSGIGFRVKVITETKFNLLSLLP